MSMRTVPEMAARMVARHGPVALRRAYYMEVRKGADRVRWLAIIDEIKRIQNASAKEPK